MVIVISYCLTKFLQIQRLKHKLPLFFVNFSMETAHLAKNQILQQAATAMLAQANQGQQGLLQLIHG